MSVNYILNVSRPVRTSGLCRWDKVYIGCKNRLCGFILVKNNSIRLKIVTTNTRISIFACFTEKRNPARLINCMTTVTALMILMPYQCDIFYLIFNQIQHLFPLIEVWLLLDTHDIPESGLFFVLNVLMKQNLFRVNRKPWIIYNKNKFFSFSFWWTGENYSIKFLYNWVFSKPFELDYNLFLFKKHDCYNCSFL